ncbi:hypothetical protein HOLleu_13166 [Holothuria leucospilota]|uniref:Uncharacterized protein n=1 Tax=Holothuria leucospilota TaxID=206669 RepID=A0A9Q1CC45_HOLLE|nr:hypothetical protein HOLleu_13166 [Holothuria leucospilota]
MVHSKLTCSTNPRTSITTYYRAVVIPRTAPKLFHTVKHSASNASVPQTDFEIRTNDLSSHLRNRQYLRGSIEYAVKKARDTTRSETLTYKSCQSNSNRVPLVTEYHPGLPPLAKFIRKHLAILQSTVRLNSIFPDPPPPPHHHRCCLFSSP